MQPNHTHNPPLSRSSSVSGFALFGFCLAVLASLAIMLAGLGSRWGWWNFSTGFSILQWGAYGGVTASTVSLVGGIMARPGGSRRGLVLAIAGLLIGLIMVWVPWQWKQTAQRVPLIHDITTDTENPPSFVAILPLRKNAANPADYGGPKIAALQRAGYPNLGPVTLNAPPHKAFQQALAAARAMGWEIVEASPAEGRIEATDTTFWFGFKDDIVIRVAPQDGGSRIDVRSVSRVGRSDVGSNASRIRHYLEKVIHNR